MWRTLVKCGAAVLAVIIVSVAVYTFFIPPHVDRFFRTIMECMCIPPRWHPANDEQLLAANGWFKVNADRFTLYAPPGTMIRHRNAWDGDIVTPRFVLKFEFGATELPAAGRDTVDEPLRIEGRNAILRRATSPDGALFAGLFVPQALVLNGRPVPLVIHGTFRTSGDRAVADAVLHTISFKPFVPPEWEHQPPAVQAEPPVFDIAPDPS